MRAIVCAAPGRLEFTDIAEPVRQPGQVLVKMRRMGICGTDMHISMAAASPSSNIPASSAMS